MTASIGPEERLQRAVVQYLRLALRDTECLWWHVPNGGHRAPSTAARLKLMGVRAGVPDLAFILPEGRAAFVELKAGPGRLTDSQRTFRHHAEALGALWAEARSLPDVCDILTGWGVPLHAKFTGE